MEHLIYVNGPKQADEEKAETGLRRIAMPYEVIRVNGYRDGCYARTDQFREGYRVYRWKTRG